jgi:hypothetical protein
MYKTLQDFVGNTPLVRLVRIPGVDNDKRNNVILAKLEGNNPAGSVKDRPALSMIQPGQWFLKSRTGTAGNRSVCVNDVRALLQVEHGAAMCNRFVIANTSRETTVHYTCPGSGHGRTTIKVETPRLIQIESQGIARQEPFAVEFEGRRTGECKVAVQGALH